MAVIEDQFYRWKSKKCNFTFTIVNLPINLVRFMWLAISIKCDSQTKLNLTLNAVNSTIKEFIEKITVWSSVGLMHVTRVTIEGYFLYCWNFLQKIIVCKRYFFCCHVFPTNAAEDVTLNLNIFSLNSVIHSLKNLLWLIIHLIFFYWFSFSMELEGK